MGRNFQELLEAHFDAGHHVCVGLDSELEKLPPSVRFGDIEEDIVRFNKRIIDATCDIVCAYKPNMAFYLRYWDAGLRALARTCRHIRTNAPNVPVIIDGKWSEISNSLEGYAVAVFDQLEADAATINPYMSIEMALDPFLKRANKGVFALCRTSNEGSDEFQGLSVMLDAGRCGEIYPSMGFERTLPVPETAIMPLYKYVAYRMCRIWRARGSCGLVVGATYPEELAEVRDIIGDMPLLVPGVGHQGGDIESVVRCGIGEKGFRCIINLSRAVLYGSGGSDFDIVGRRVVESTNETIVSQLQRARERE